MKDFLKFTLATVTGIIVSSVVLFFISILMVFSMVSSSESETQVRKNSVMMLELNGTLAERSQENPLDFLMGDDYKTYGLDDILAAIKKAKEHEDIKVSISRQPRWVRDLLRWKKYAVRCKTSRSRENSSWLTVMPTRRGFTTCPAWRIKCC